MVFKLVRTDIIDAHKIELPLGEHLFGRGKFLDCEDKRISRKHGQLQVTEDSVVLKSLHQNPCFYTKCGSDEVIILKLDSTTKLSHGDRFGLLPTSYWYELLNTTLPANENQPNRVQNNVNNTLAATQPMDDVVESDIPNDKDKMADKTMLNGRSESPTFSLDGNPQDETGFGNDSELLGVNFDEPVEENNRAVSPSLIPPDNAQTTEPPPISPDPDTSTKPPEIPSNPDPSPSSPTKRANPEELQNFDVKKVKTEPQNCGGTDDNAGLDVAGPSNPSLQPVKLEPVSPVKPEPSSPVKPEPSSPVKPPSTPQPQPGPSRERCFYAARCYRRNPQHKADFSHPSDADWGSGDVGHCPHGAACMKRDPRHWKTHTHPPGTQQPSNQYQPGMRQVHRHGNIFYINAHTVNFYDDHFEAVDSEDDSVDYDYEF